MKSRKAIKALEWHSKDVITSLVWLQSFEYRQIYKFVQTLWVRAVQ